MSRTKEIITAAGTLACALGIGFALQNTDTASKRYGEPGAESVAPVKEKAAQEADVAAHNGLTMEVHDVTLTSALPHADSSVLANTSPLTNMISRVSLLPIPAPKSEAPTVSVTSCDIEFTATAMPAAFVTLSLNAPCMSNERVTINHEGMTFAALTDTKGQLELSVPALAQTAVFMISFSGNDMNVAETTVADVSEYNRVVLQWEGNTGFQLHAREFGAEYGSKGHVWRGSVVTDANLLAGAGGYLVPLGSRGIDRPIFAEVYTFPASMSASSGQIDLSVEAQVTPNNCGSEIEASTLETRGGAAMQSRNVSFSVPACDTVGDYLVLNNVFEDLKIASR